jgi:TRAP-type C4-dicarboxylate transport system permease small subunit
MRCGADMVEGGRFAKVTRWLETMTSSVLLCAMILMVILQIILRNICSSGITGGAEIVRHLVLWVAFIGAAMAARNDMHIKIDAFYRIIPGTFKPGVRFLTHLFTTAVCAMLFKASIGFILIDYRSNTVIAFHDMPVWILELVIPVGYFSVLAWYGYRSFLILSNRTRRH